LLRGKIDRSGASIEFKHRNISAVLELLGLYPIRGYLPAQNFQKAIVGAVDRYLSINPGALHPEVLADGLAERPGLFVEPPPLLLPPVNRREDVERIVRKFNPVERDFRNRKLGRDGEELVLHFARIRFDGCPRKMAMELVTTSYPSTREVRSDFLRSRQP
jgi:hypothetical protein